MLITTSIAASILGILYAKLALNVIGLRRKHGVGLGDGGHKDLLCAMRAQANLAEYAPIGLILIACLEINNAALWLLIPLAAMFTLGRVLHPMGMKEKGIPPKARILGMQLTLLGLIALIVTNLGLAVFKIF